MYIRPAELSDVDDLVVLATLAGTGLTSLQPNPVSITNKIQRSIQTFQEKLPQAEQLFLFVLVDSETQKVVGISGIEVALGLQEPWYNFRIDHFPAVESSGIQRRSFDVLNLSNDHTGCSELCTLFLHPDWRRNKNGQLLSKARFLFLAAFRYLFGKRIVAEMRGWSDEYGESPFWNAVTKQFFKMSFQQADYLSGIGEKTFIAELMPRHPLYCDLLPDDARQVIGAVHEQTKPARAMLEAEGLQYHGYIDIFDGGATLDASIDELRVMHEGCISKVEMTKDTAMMNKTWILVSNMNKKSFRCILIYRCFEVKNAISLTESEIHSLFIHHGDEVFIYPVYPVYPGCK